MPRANIKEIVAERWLEVVRDMRSDANFARWDSDLDEIEYILTEHRPFYWTLRPLIGIVGDWEWDDRTFRSVMETGKMDRGTLDKHQLDAETRARFLSVLKEMQADEQFRRYFYELDELIRHIDEEVFLVYGLQRIKNVLDGE